ncbi:50S ribosomal protein L18 [Halothermothrix orenii]|uniref:Large ribosomal subunit protein uL18 n=1 Tax=Halothermothrix orenii (strain H 168 / OCM 544 / DSM 9562) TaxID=373903 RepID=B8D0E0_HALOH|nr:ribosomal protein L18 [Halothermothrix orenii H 168]
MDKRLARKRRHLRIRNKIFGTPERPRMSVFRSKKNIYVQVIDDISGHTLVSASSLDPAIRDEIDNGGNVEAAKKVGELVAERALEKGIKKVVFDRGGNRYHGRIKALAEAARAKGLKF